MGKNREEDGRTVTLKMIVKAEHNVINTPTEKAQNYLHAVAEQGRY